MYMSPQEYNNLVPDSPLHRHLESLLLKHKAGVPVQKVCEKVLMIPGLDEPNAAALVETFIKDDPRFSLNGNGSGTQNVGWAKISFRDIWNTHRRLAVFDLETVSEGPEAPRIMEVGFSFVEDGKIVEEWETLVNPKRSISSYVRRLTGINNAAVRQAPTWEEVMPQVLEKLQGTILVAHQAVFDYDCLNNEISRLTEHRLTNRYMCTVEMSRTLLPGSENYRLETLSQWLDLTHDNPHRAGSDARATAELFCHMFRTVEADWSEYLRPLPPKYKPRKPRRSATKSYGSKAEESPAD
jgi:DNA polymerase III epsilon subunit family exonuclease